MLLRDPRSDDVAGLYADGLGSLNPVELINHARRTIDHDPRTARRYLDRLALVFGHGGEHRRLEEVLVPPLPQGTEVGTITRGGLAPWQLQKVSDYVEERLGDTIALEGLAGLVRLSTGHFCRAFKVTVGETPHAFLIRRRIRRAQTLMLTTRDSLSHIACTCGLTDQAHLTRLFRRMVGDTPLAWRRTWSHLFECGDIGTTTA